MFTGLVQATGTLRRLDEAAEARRIEIEVALDPGLRGLGASVAVNGVCLTVTRADERSFAADVGFETLDKTTLGRLAVGAPVNIEPSLRLGDPLGGHLVSGHVDGVGRLRSLERRGDAIKMSVWAPAGLRHYIAVKGSMCIDGVSLTVNEVDPEGFCVGLVPHTLAVTTLGGLGIGAEVNLEVDLLARYVERILQRGDGDGSGAAASLGVDQLARAGFLQRPEPEPRS